LSVLYTNSASTANTFLKGTTAEPCTTHSSKHACQSDSQP
jgi:hypothetical protein